MQRSLCWPISGSRNHHGYLVQILQCTAIRSLPYTSKRLVLTGFTQARPDGRGMGLIAISPGIDPFRAACRYSVHGQAGSVFVSEAPVHFFSATRMSEPTSPTNRAFSQQSEHTGPPSPIEHFLFTCSGEADRSISMFFNLRSAFPGDSCCSVGRGRRMAIHGFSVLSELQRRVLLRKSMVYGPLPRTIERSLVRCSQIEGDMSS